MADREGEVVGFTFGVVTFVEGGAPGKGLVLDELYVRKDARGRGLGGRLLAVLEEHARAAGLEAIETYSSAKDIHRILRFYESHGYEAWHVLMYRGL